MAFPRPEYSKSAVNRAGEKLISFKSSSKEIEQALVVLNNWRACHGYPLNTFQSTLRRRLKDFSGSFGAERLKRMTTIVSKLKLYKGMQLARMQDIGGLRAVVKTITDVRDLEAIYVSDKRMQHRLVGSDDYILNPKTDGYRGIHLIYKYKNPINPVYDGFLLELQIRTRLQHTWATAVETMGTYLGQALKSGEGERKWRDFFAITSSAFTYIEKSPPLKNYSRLSQKDTFKAVAHIAKDINALDIMRDYGFALDIIQNKVGKANYYHLVILNSLKRSVEIKSYPKADIERATEDYTEAEARARKGEKIESVLVSAGDIRLLKKAYPNYFLDVQDFIAKVEVIIKESKAKIDYDKK